MSNPEDILTDPQWIAFQAMLDENPASHETRAVLADWLENFGHPWARAYRWMYLYKRYPHTSDVCGGWYYDEFLGAFDLHKHARLFGIFPYDNSSDVRTLMINSIRFDAEISLCRQFHRLPLRGKGNV